MDANRTVGALVTGVALCVVGYSGPKVAAQAAKFATRSDYPITIVSITGKPTGETLGKASMPLVDFTITLRNATQQPVICYTLSFSWYDANGAAASGGHVRYSGGDWSQPSIPSGGTATAQEIMLQRSGTLKATVDFVLLADGTYYGRDRFRTLDMLQKHLEATRSVEENVLSLLNTEGPDAVKRFLTSELAQGAQDQKLLKAKLAGFTNASLSYTP
jgi:hypothetical protein